MPPWLDHGAQAVLSVADVAFGAWGGPAAVIDVYEAAVGTAVAAQQHVARNVAVSPLRSVVALCADLTRDVGALQTSAARWALDL